MEDKKIVRYIVKHCNSDDTLNKFAEEKIKEGFQPFGSPTTSIYTDDDNMYTVIVCQAFVIYE